MLKVVPGSSGSVCWSVGRVVVFVEWLNEKQTQRFARKCQFWLGKLLGVE